MTTNLTVAAASGKRRVAFCNLFFSETNNGKWKRSFTTCVLRRFAAKQTRPKSSAYMAEQQLQNMLGRTSNIMEHGVSHFLHLPMTSRGPSRWRTILCLSPRTKNSMQPMVEQDVQKFYHPGQPSHLQKSKTAYSCYIVEKVYPDNKSSDHLITKQPIVK